MSNYNPGPWDMRDNGLPGLRHFKVMAEEVTIADQLHENHARLIAASPDLLGVAWAFQEFLEVFNRGAFKGLLKEPQYFPLVSKLRRIETMVTDVIAKAEGKS